MRQAEKHERIRQMLGRLSDALEPAKGVNTGGDQNDSKLLLHPPDFNKAMRELDRCLTRMRKHGNQQAIHGVPLRTVYWHVTAWYIDVPTRQVPVRAKKLTPNGWKWAPSGRYQLQPMRHRDAQQAKADLGIPWLAREYNWDSIHLHAILEACGERQPKEHKAAA